MLFWLDLPWTLSAQLKRVLIFSSCTLIATFHSREKPPWSRKHATLTHSVPYSAYNYLKSKAAYLEFKDLRISYNVSFFLKLLSPFRILSPTYTTKTEHLSVKNKIKCLQNFHYANPTAIYSIHFLHPMSQIWFAAFRTGCKIELLIVKILWRDGSLRQVTEFVSEWCAWTQAPTA